MPHLRLNALRFHYHLDDYTEPWLLTPVTKATRPSRSIKHLRVPIPKYPEVGMTATHK